LAHAVGGVRPRTDQIQGDACPFAGEILGGLYFHNYGSGTGLVAGVVFGRIAGRQAAGFVAKLA
jgi:succinate dehydrogenase/fumarate reductase flavoprotein subunit